MKRVKIILGDITKIKVEVIVNAANKTLLGGGGVDEAIHRAAGPLLLEECRKFHGCEIGQAKITKGYNLPAKYVIHTVGPVYGKENGHEPELLKNCYVNSLNLAKKYNLTTIAFPSISTGAYGYPIEKAVGIVSETLREYLKEDNFFKEIILVLHSVTDLNIYLSVFNIDK